MPVEVTMPKFGLTMHEGTVQRYFKAVGDQVAEGEPLYEVETEKVLYEVESPSAGVLATTLVEEGAIVECGGLVAVLAEPGEDVAAIASRYNANLTRASADAHSGAGAQPAREGKTAGERRLVSPVARKLAAEHRVNLDLVTGTGPGGRVTREDVERAARSAGDTSTTISGERIALRGVRKIVAERMHQSLHDSAQITISTEADVTLATQFRSNHKGEFDFTYTDMIVHAVARALRKHSRMNSRLDGAAIVLQPAVNVGVAVSLTDGLIVPVVHDADRKSLEAIAGTSATLVEKARSGRLRLEDVTDGTFTVTNLGALGIDAFTPILNPGETGILGVGRIVEKPVFAEGRIVARSMATFSLTFDHRVIDGAPAAEFLQTFVTILNSGEPDDVAPADSRSP